MFSEKEAEDREVPIKEIHLWHHFSLLTECDFDDNNEKHEP
jgi:hypothetical protein